MQAVLTTISTTETRALAARIGSRLPIAAVVLLDGEVGAGKTVFTKGLYEGLGGPDPDQVTSPTYTIVQRYDDADRPFHHVDLYRLGSKDDIFSIEYEDFLFPKRGLTVVEWPAAVIPLVESALRLLVEIEVDSLEGPRTFTITADDEAFIPVFDEVRS